MGVAGAALARASVGRPRPSRPSRPARSRERPVVPQTNRLSLAVFAARSAAALDRPLLLYAVDGRWHVRRAAAGVARADAPARGAERAAQRRDHRQPDGQDGRSVGGGRLGRRQVTAGAQTPRGGGYAGLLVGDLGAGGEHFGSRWRLVAAGAVSGALP